MIDIEFCGRLSGPYGPRAHIDLPAGAHDVASLRAHLAATHGSDDLLQASVRAVVNDAVVREDHPVRDGDRVAFLPPVGGG